MASRSFYGEIDTSLLQSWPLIGSFLTPVQPLDRLIWDKLQVLADPQYRASFSRAEQALRTGESTPQFSQ
jgi:hypothetical protein